MGFPLGLLSSSGSQYFYTQNNNLTVLNMPFNGTNGSTTFTDTTGRHTTTFAGTISLSTAQFQSSPSSLFANAANSYVVSDVNGNSTDFIFYGDFVINFWLRTVDTTTRTVFILCNQTDYVTFDHILYVQTSGGNINVIANATTILTTTHTANVWTGYGIGRTNGVMTLYKNGVPIKVFDSTHIYGSGNMYLMGNNNGLRMNGHLDDLIVQNNGAIAPIVSSTIVTYLEFNGSDGSTAFTDTTGRHTYSILAGSPVISTSRFYTGTSSLKLAGAAGISANIDSDFTFNSDFEVSFYFNIEISSSSDRIFTVQISSSYSFLLTVSSTGNLVLTNSSGEYSNTDVATTNTCTINTWNKAVLRRIDNRLFVVLNDGAQSSYLSVPDSLQSTIVAITTNAGTTVYIDEFKITKYYPSSANATIVQKLRFNGTNGTTNFIDSSGRHPIGLGASSNITLTTGQFIEGTSSVNISSSTAQGTYLIGDAIGISNDFIFSGDFKIMLYTKPSSPMSLQTPLVRFGTYQLLLEISGDQRVTLYNGSNIVSSTAAVGVNVWNKVELRRSGGMVRILVNDSSGSAVALSGTLGDGIIYYGNNQYYISSMPQHYMDYVTVINYDAVATISAVIKLHISFNGNNGGTTFTDVLNVHTLTRTGTGTTSSAVTAYEGLTSMLCPSGDNYISTENHADFIWPADFNMTFWFRPTSTSVSCVLFSFTDFSLKTTTSGSNISLAISGTHGSTTLVPTNTFTNAAWNKVIFKRVGTTTYLILNDNVANQATINTAGMQTSIGDGVMKIGNQTAIVASNSQCNIDNFIITKG